MEIVTIIKSLSQSTFPLQHFRAVRESIGWGFY